MVRRKRKAVIGRVFGVILSVCMIAGNIGITRMQGNADILTGGADAPHQNHKVCSDIEYFIDADGNKHSSTGNCSHAVVTWTAWGNGTDEDTSLPTATGNYYLENDVTLTSTWEPADGTALCLNGHSISGDVSDTLITINASFSLTDCRKDVGSIKNSGGRAVYIPGAGSIFEFYGGRLTGEFEGIGAGIYMKDNGTLNMYGGVIEHCVAAMKGSDYKYSSSGKGGGVYMSGGYFNMYGGSISNNDGAQSSIQDAPYGAVFGAGIYESGGYFMMYGGAVTGNYAANTGGGLYEGSSYGADSGHQYANTIYNGTISDNVARLKGGGIYLCNTDYLNIRGGLISGNQCKDASEGQGGGICTNGWLYIYGGSISNNKAANGGGIYVISGAGETNFYGGEIVGNEAYANGGGVCNSHYFGMNMKERINSQDVVYGGGKISGNKAVNGGGIYSTYHIGIFAGEITDNTVSGVGGGVYIGNATYYTSNRISGGKIINNYKVTQNEDGTEAKSNNNLYEYNEADRGYAMYGYFCISSALDDDIRIGISTYLIPASEDDTSSIIAAMSTDKKAYEIQETDIIGSDGTAKLFADDSDNYTVAYDADNKRVYLKKNASAAESTDTPYSFSVRLVETENSVAAAFNDSNVESAIVEDSEKVDNTAIEADFTVEKISETEENKARVAYAVANASITAVAYYDISLTKNVTKSGVSEQPVNIAKTRENTTISITMPIPENMKGGTASEYKVVRIHNDAGTVTTELLTDTVYSADNNTVTFMTDRFSTYALAYIPTAASTSDNDEDSTKPSSKEDDSTTQASTENSTTTQATTGDKGTTQATTGDKGTTQATTGSQGTTQATTGSQGTSQAATESSTSPSRASTESSTYSTQPSKESKTATQAATESNTSPSRASTESSTYSTQPSKESKTSTQAAAESNTSPSRVNTEVAAQNITLTNDSNNIGKNSTNESITERSLVAKDAEPKTGDLRESKALVFVNIGTAAAVIYLLETLVEILCRCRKFIRIRG